MSTNADNPLCKKITLEPRFDEMVFITLEMLILVGLSRFFHLFLKRLGQPTIVSQMAAGLFFGRTFMSHAVHFQLYNLNDDDHLINMATMGSSFFMFLIGLEMDFNFLRRSFRIASFINFATLITSTLVAIIEGPILYQTVNVKGRRGVLMLILIILLSNSSSPMLIRMMTELKLTMSGVGRIGIAASLINDAAFLTIISFFVLFLTPEGAQNMSSSDTIVNGIGGLVLVGIGAAGLRGVVQMINRMNKKRQVILDEVLWAILMLVIVIAAVMDSLGFQSMIVGFILGAAFPRVGPAARTVTSKLTSPVNTFVLPVYFGYAGVQTDLFMLGDSKVLEMVATLVILGTLGKVVSTVVASRALGMQVKEGMVLGFLLNVKGHVELILIALGTRHGIWGEEVNQALLISMLFNSMTAGPAAAYIVWRERRAVKYQSSGLEWLDLHKELRIMTCIHSPHDLPTLLDLMQISSGMDRTPFTPYLMHLIEFNDSMTTPMLYNQIEENYSHDIHGQNVRQVNATVDTFKLETGIMLHQLTAISRFANMHENLCNGAQDIRASLIIVPYHRKQRFDGRMGKAKEGIREFNANVLRSAPCTVGILVDRGLSGRGGGSVGGTANSVQAASPTGDKQALYEVVVLFLGGADDREAVAYGSRIAMHPSVSVTVVRFMSAFGRNSIVSRMGSTNSHRSGDVLIQLEEEEEAVADSPDEEFMADFHNTFLATGMITYVEQVVANSSDMVAALATMHAMYSLFIVGRQRQGHTAHLTEGLSMWQECKELGEIGDLLASSDFMLHGSVLVVQQHNASKTMYI